MSLNDRISKYKNDTDTNLILEIHLNAGKGTGSEVYYYDGDAIGKSYAATISQFISNTLVCKESKIFLAISLAI